jgi:hypothetical protein
MKSEKNKFRTEQVHAVLILWTCIGKVLGLKISRPMVILTEGLRFIFQAVREISGWYLREVTTVFILIPSTSLFTYSPLTDISSVGNDSVVKYIYHK